MTRPAARFLALFVALAGCVFVLTGPAVAACQTYADDQARYSDAAHRASFIFIGNITKATTSDDGSTVFYEISVTENIKNSVGGEVTIHTPAKGPYGLALGNTRTLVIQLTDSGEVTTCDGTTQGKVSERAQIVKDTLHPKPTPTPTRSRSPRPTPTATKSATPSASPSLSPSPSPSPSPTETAVVVPTESPSSVSPTPSPSPSTPKNVNLSADSGVNKLQVIIAAALGLLVIVGGITLMRVTRPPRP